MQIEMGNAHDDSTINAGGEKTGWFIGSNRFISKPGLRQCEDMELKWSVHPEGFDSGVKPCSPNLGVTILVQGRLLIAFRTSPDHGWHEYRLTKPGDYIISRGGLEHRYRAEEDTTLLTVRLTENQRLPVST